jgi:hypothetical protein
VLVNKLANSLGIICGSINIIYSPAFFRCPKYLKICLDISLFDVQM